MRKLTANFLVIVLLMIVSFEIGQITTEETNLQNPHPDDDIVTALELLTTQIANSDDLDISRVEFILEILFLERRFL